MKNSLYDKYYIWIVRNILHCEVTNKLLQYLFSTGFCYISEEDKNRYENGIDLRYEFFRENNIPYENMDVLNDIPCNMLEMMVALTFKIYGIIESPTSIDISELFQLMLQSSWLFSLYDDEEFDETIALIAVTKILNRDYDRDGDGGLFYIPGIDKDMTKLNLWDQAMAWTNYIIEMGWTENA